MQQRHKHTSRNKHCKDQLGFSILRNQTHNHHAANTIFYLPPEFNEAHEALKFISLEFQAVVINPFPEAFTHGWNGTKKWYYL